MLLSSSPSEAEALQEGRIPPHPSEKQDVPGRVHREPLGGVREGTAQLPRPLEAAARRELEHEDVVGAGAGEVGDAGAGVEVGGPLERAGRVNRLASTATASPDKE